MLKLNKKMSFKINNQAGSVDRAQDMRGFVSCVSFLLLIALCLYPDISFATLNSGGKDLEALSNSAKTVAIDKVGMAILGIGFLLAAIVALIKSNISIIFGALGVVFIYVVGSAWISGGMKIAGFN